MQTVLRGRMSTFGGPEDTGVGPDEGLALVDADNFAQVRAYFLPDQPPGTSGLARRLNPATFYIACRWNYHDTPRDVLLRTRVTVHNPANGRTELAQPIDFGPAVSTGRVADLSPGLASALGLDTDEQVEVTIPGGSGMPSTMRETRTLEYHFQQARAYKPGRALPIQSLILHSTDGRKAGDIATLTGDSVSVHWYVTRAGEIFHFVADADTAFHVGKPTDPKFSNAASIGIEQEHFDPDPQNGKPHNEDWPDVQVHTVATLCAFVFQQFGLAQDAIHSHAQVAFPPGRKQDPFGYPFDTLFGLIQEALHFEWQAVSINGD